MQELLELILKNALGPDIAFDIDRREDPEGIVFFMNVPTELKGKIIGKQGRNIKAIRDILNIVARREGQKVYLKVADEL